jgi:hypothetical protein
VYPVKYAAGVVYIPEYGILRSHRHENLKSYMALTGWNLYQRRNVFAVRYELGFYIPEDILHSHRRGNLNSYNVKVPLRCFKTLGPVSMRDLSIVRTLNN